MQNNTQLNNWRLNIAKVKSMNFSRFIIIPFTMANDMELEPGDYVRMEYDDKEKCIKIKKNK